MLSSQTLSPEIVMHQSSQQSGWQSWYFKLTSAAASAETMHASKASKQAPIFEFFFNVYRKFRASPMLLILLNLVRHRKCEVVIETDHFLKTLLAEHRDL